MYLYVMNMQSKSTSPNELTERKESTKTTTHSHIFKMHFVYSDALAKLITTHFVSRLFLLTLSLDKHNSQGASSFYTRRVIEYL